MKRIYLLIAGMFILNSIQAQLYLSEIHYDNSGADVNERIEVFGPAGTDLTGSRIILYNGSGGVSYNTSNLSGTIPNNCTIGGISYGVVVVSYAGILQNGNPDGFALVNALGTVIEFLSYGGTFTATNGPALGMTSTDIGATESASSTSTGSIQRNSTGNSWTTNVNTNTFGSCNTSFVFLPVRFGNIKASQQGSAVKIEWSNFTETDVVSYKVERSIDGQSFSTLSTVNARLNNGGRADYSYYDAVPASGVNLYRIQSTETDGKQLHSVIVRVDTKSDKSTVSVYPNPGIATAISFQATDLQKGSYTILVYNNAGQQVHSKKITHTGGFVTSSLELPTGLKAGVYQLQIVNTVIRLSRSFMIR